MTGVAGGIFGNNVTAARARRIARGRLLTDPPHGVHQSVELSNVAPVVVHLGTLEPGPAWLLVADGVDEDAVPLELVAAEESRLEAETRSARGADSAWLPVKP